VDTRPSSDTAPTCCDKVVARRPLQGEAGASQRVAGVTREDGGPAPKSHRRAGAFAGPAGRPRRRRADDTKSESNRVSGKEVGMVSN
jgi:hypothetical protein